MSRYNDPAVNKVLTLIRGFEAGYYDLPQEVLAARRALEQIEAARTEANTKYGSIHPGGVQQGVVAAVLANAAKGPLDPAMVQPVLDTTEEQVRLSHWLRILDEAVTQAAYRLPSIAREHADRIIEEGLRPALDKVLASAYALHSKVDLRNVPFGNEAALARADKPLRDAFVAVGDLTDTYGVLRSAQATLRDLMGAPSEDAFVRFREVENAYEVMPLLGGYSEPAKPWDLVPGGKVVWIATTPEARIWMPTADECEFAYLARVSAGGLRKANVDGVFVPTA